MVANSKTVNMECLQNVLQKSFSNFKRLYIMVVKMLRNTELPKEMFATYGFSYQNCSDACLQRPRKLGLLIFSEHL